MLKVVQQFGVKDKFESFYRIAQVEYDELPEWVDEVITKCSDTDIRYALDRYPDPLVRLIRYTPKQVLTRISVEDRRCQIWKGCVSWRESECLNMNKNVCRVYEAPGATLELRMALTELMNLWRDGWNVVTVETDSRE